MRRGRSQNLSPPRRLSGLVLAVWLLANGLAALGTAGPAAAQALVADLSSHLVAITTGFTGTEVVLFGAIEGPGDVAVVVTGPRTTVTVRRKDRVAGLWLNGANLRFEQVPGFYAVATSGPLADLVAPAVLRRHQIGLENLALRTRDRMAEEKVAEFRDSLIRNMQRLGLYRDGSNQVAFLGQKLFRTSLYFPANVPIGIYTVNVFLIRDRDIVSAQTTPLAVDKVGVSAEIFEMARQRPWLYAFVALSGALLVGLAAGAVFRE